MEPWHTEHQCVHSGSFSLTHSAVRHGSIKTTAFIADCVSCIQIHFLHSDIKGEHTRPRAVPQTTENNQSRGWDTEVLR